MPSSRTLVLDHHAISQKIKRITYQIYERNYDEKEIVLVAVEKKGVELASRIEPQLKEVAGMKVKKIRLTINKNEPLKPIKLSEEGESLKGKPVVLIDDVLNSGKTLIYAVRHIINYPVKNLITVVLVDRKHRRYPIKADFAGITLSTTLQDHISVEFKKGDDRVYLE